MANERLAALYDPLIAPLDPLGVRKWRRWAVSTAYGYVLELGVGTGLNLPHYRAAESVAAIDPDRASLERARVRKGGNLTVGLYQATAEELPFATAAFDSVVGTLVFCTIPNPERALLEVRRVLKPGGMFRLIEHVRVNQPVVGSLQDRLTPAWEKVAGGCHLNRDTAAAVERAGFRVTAVHRHLRGFVIGIDATSPADKSVR